jgi:hypothetical protein
MGIGAPLAPIPSPPLEKLQHHSCILLTPANGPTIVTTVPKLPSSDALPRRGAKRDAWVCLLLALLFLYNPYLSAPASAGGLNVKHSASHRATVGSSELEKYSSPSTPNAYLYVAVFFENVISSLPSNSSLSLLPQSAELPPSHQFLCASLWFRPPPAL